MIRDQAFDGALVLAGGLEETGPSSGLAATDAGQVAGRSRTLVATVGERGTQAGPDGVRMTDRIECRYHGRDFSAQEMALLRVLSAGPPALDRYALSRVVRQRPVSFPCLFRGSGAFHPALFRARPTESATMDGLIPGSPPVFFFQAATFSSGGGISSASKARSGIHRILKCVSQG